MANSNTGVRRKPRFKERNAAKPRPKAAPPPAAAPAPPVQRPRPSVRVRPVAMPALTLEAVLYFSILAVGFALRIADAGSRAMHGDEAVHAWISWNLYRGAGYQYDPVYHGPFQFPLTAAFYFLFGVSNVTGRLLSILFGTALVGMPFFLRHWMGRAEALLAALLIAVSPAFVYVSRLERDDSFTAFFAILMAIAIFSYLRTRAVRWVYIGCATAALSLTAMENTYITLFMFGSFLLIAWASEAAAVRPLGNTLARYWTATGTEDRLKWTVWGATLGLVLLAFVFTLITGSYPPVPTVVAILLILFVTRATFLAARTTGETAFLSAVTSVRRTQWVNALTVVVAILFLFFSTFGTNLQGVWDSSQPFFNNGHCSYNSFPLNPCRRDIIGGLFYWLSQHNVHRGGQPWYYYTLLFSLYEQLVLVFGIGGILWTLRRPTLFRVFVTYWALLAFGIYSWAGEKFSWLMIHPLLPFTLMAAMFVVYALRSAGQFRWIILALLALLGALQLHSTWEVNYINGADPVEMMVYVQSSPDTPRIASDILAISNRATNGNDLHVTIDTEDTWPFAWYLRDMPNVAYPAAADLTSKAYISNPVILVDETHVSTVGSRLAKDYSSQRARLRWWFPEDYKTWSWGDFGSRLISPNYWSVVWQWLIDRRPFGPKGAVWFYYYVKHGLVSPY